MKRLLTFLLFAITLSSTPVVQAAGFFESVVDSLNRMSASDVEIYDTSYTSSAGTSVIFSGKLKNRSVGKTIKEVILTINTKDCKSDCKNCILVNEVSKKVLNPDLDVLDSLTRTLAEIGAKPRTLYSNSSFQFRIKFDDITEYASFVQKRGNETCFNWSVKRVIGLGALQKALDY